MITTFNTVFQQSSVSVLLFYDGSTPPSGIFDAFLSTPQLTADVGTRSLSSLVKAAPSDVNSGTRGLFNMIGVSKFTPSLIAQVANQSTYWGTHYTTSDEAVFISVDVEPFHSSYFSHSKGGAYPHDPSKPLFPLLLNYAWLLPSSDAYFKAVSKESARVLLNQAISEGQNIAGSNQIVYSNYVLPDTPLASMFGSNVARLQKIKKQYDPLNVMGLAGGFKF